MATKKQPVSQAKTTPPEVIAEIYLIPMDRIEVSDQVRTEFDDSSIEELAKDIEARGLRNPVEVSPIADERYRLTLGGRRWQAIKFLGHSKIPAIIVKTDDQARLFDQLAENIQRENLSLQDEANAIRKAYDKLESLDQVAKFVNKSKPWVSKRLALTYPDFSWRGRQLLESGQCEDIEILNVLSQLDTIDYSAANAAHEQIKRGELSRQDARTILKTAKENKKLRDNAKATPPTAEEIEAAEQAQKDAERAQEEAKRLKEEGTGPEFLKWAVQQLNFTMDNDEDMIELIGTFRQDQREVIEGHFVSLAEKAKSMPISELLRIFRYNNTGYLPEIEALAMIASLKGVDLAGNLYAFISTVEATNKSQGDEA